MMKMMTMKTKKKSLTMFAEAAKRMTKMKNKKILIWQRNQANKKRTDHHLINLNLWKTL